MIEEYQLIIVLLVNLPKKTEEAITGIINQLDNFLGREEIQYIFCDRNNSINLSEVLEKGECVAV